MDLSSQADGFRKRCFAVSLDERPATGTVGNQLFIH
jgi:hypothetical protein